MANEKFSLIILHNGVQRILVNIGYGITTSSGQSDYARKSEVIAETLRKNNELLPNEQKIVYINVIDGAGWVARQADLDRIQRASYLLNLNSLDRLKDIINYYLK
ncbi:MAG: hypothetical protein LBE09_02200 [Christensenellaceae bacterium]|nr:hypothetical protein [Christensenellaceae bacterium]